MTASLSEITSLRLGGPARLVVEARDEQEILARVREADAAAGDAEAPLLILGGASNVVIADEGYPGTVLLIRNRGVRFEDAGEDRVRVTAAAGEVWDELVLACVGRGLAGIECLSGIPGTVGATPIQNVGAYGQEVADTIVSVRAYDREAGDVVELSPAECEFGYRDSALKRRPGRWVVLAVTFELRRSELSMPIRYDELAARLGVAKGERAPLGAVREAVLELRRGKGLLAEPGDPEAATAGSFFTNPLLTAEQVEQLQGRTGEASPPLYPQPDGSFKTSAAWLIQHAGFEPGYSGRDGIAISSRHCLVLTNRGGGSTAELIRLAREIAAGVRERFGVDLHPEPILIGIEW